MKEIVEAVNSRFRAPYFGYSVLALIAFNWRGFFLLALTPGSPDARLEAFDSVTSTVTLIAYPLLTGIIVAATADWIAYFFRRVSDKPRELHSGLRLNAEHKETVLRTSLEKARAELVEVREQELIDRAKRDQQLASLPDAPEKNVVTDQISALRETRDKEFSDGREHSDGRPTLAISDIALDLLRNAGEDGLGTIVRIMREGKPGYELARTRMVGETAQNIEHIRVAVEELVRAGLLKKAGMNGDTHVLTDLGWRAYYGLKKKSPT